MPHPLTEAEKAERHRLLNLPPAELYLLREELARQFRLMRDSAGEFNELVQSNAAYLRRCGVSQRLIQLWLNQGATIYNKTLNALAAIQIEEDERL